MNSLYFGSILTVFGMSLLLLRHRIDRRTDSFWAFAWGASGLLAAALTWQLTGDSNGMAVPLAVACGFALLVRLLLRRSTAFGAGLLASRIGMAACGLAFIHESTQGRNWPAPAWTGYYLSQVLVFGSAVVGTFFGIYSGLAEFCLTFPKRDAALKTIAAGLGAKTPKISIHVPCYAEPPDLVIATLNAISNLRYPDFEVLVIDNNTKNPALWQPVEAHCRRLGEQFRFFHVDPLAGAKAGAVNFALRHTAPDAEIVALVDADYISRPDFLERYAPLFADPRIGFVQTSHDYHEWQDNPFLRGAYFEYLPLHKQTQAATNEYDAAYTVGTMCMVRKEALEKAGGWAEWSLTEDSEVAVRIHALGYIGHVFAETAGRGLIPETMEGVKKQQFRWSAGPVQQFAKHWRLYLGIGGTGRMTLRQRVLEIRHSFDRLPHVMAFLMTPVAVCYCVLEIAQGSRTPVPAGVVVAIVAGILATYTEKWIVARRLGAGAVGDFLLSTLAAEALRWTFVTAFIAPFVKFKQPWNRTDKFEKSSSFSRALDCSTTETFIALAHFVVAAALLPFASFRHFDFVALTFVGLLLQGLGFLCTLVMALLSERALLARAVPTRGMSIQVEH
ncbi:MAG TPA: glycosyltransferase [Burkholderiaceae bacterium]|nr:glycosyltransferase [Burkholderiaceae bacterium]